MNRKLIFCAILFALLVFVVVTSVIAYEEDCEEEWDQCDHQEVPEFTAVGAGIALLGAGTYVAYRSKKK